MTANQSIPDNASIDLLKEAVLWVSDAESIFSNIPKLKKQAKKLNMIACEIFSFIDELEGSS